MERLVMSTGAQDHVSAYLEYRMILKSFNMDPDGPLLPDHKYEKLKKQFMEDRRRGKVLAFKTNVTKKRGGMAIKSGRVGARKALTSGRKKVIGKKASRKRVSNVSGRSRYEEEDEEAEYGGYKVITGYKTNEELSITPLELLNKKVTVKSPQKLSSRMLNLGGRSNNSSRPSKLRNHSKQKRSQRFSDLDEEEQIEILEERLETEKMSKTTRYGVEKQLRTLKARVKRKLKKAREARREQRDYL